MPRRIASVVAERAGDLVCATAGHHMEAMLAAYGSGAVLASHEAGERILNVDIGGGTTKLALVDRGRVLATAALHVGGRLIAVDGDTVTRIEPGGRMHAAAVGLDLDLGSRVGSSRSRRNRVRHGGSGHRGGARRTGRGARCSSPNRSRCRAWTA